MFAFVKNLFFKNIGMRQIIIKNVFWLTFAEVVTSIIKIGFIVIVIRILGAGEYGKYAFAFSFVSAMLVFSDLGIIDFSTRELARDKGKEKEFSKILTLYIILSAVALVLMILGSFLITENLAIRKIIFVLSFFALIGNFFHIFYSFLRSRQKMEYEAWIKIVQAIFSFILVLLIVLYFRSAIGLSYGYLLSNVIALVCLLVFFHFYIHPIKLIWDKNIFKIIKVSWPLSLGFVTSWIYLDTGSIMLGYFNLITENGWYGAAVKVAFIAVLFANLIIRSFYPALSNFFVTSSEKLQKLWNYIMGTMIFLAFPVVLGGIAMAPKIVNFFYGSDFVPSIPALQLLLIVIGINFINYPFGTMLVVSDQQKKNFLLIISGMAFNILLSSLLIPLYSLYGAIISAIISSLVVLIITIFTTKLFVVRINLLNKELFKNLAYALFSSLAMLFLITRPLIYNLNVFFSIGAGIVVYSICLAYLIGFKKLTFNRPTD